MIPFVGALSLLGGLLLWFALQFGIRGFRRFRRTFQRRNDARPPATREAEAAASPHGLEQADAASPCEPVEREGEAAAFPHGLEQADTATLLALLARLAAANAAAQEQIAPETRPRGVLRRPRSVTFAPVLASKVEIDPDGEWDGGGRRDEAEENLPSPAEETEVDIDPDGSWEGGGRRDEAEETLPSRAEETGAEIGATLCDVTGRNGVDVSAALSRDEDGDACFVLRRGEDDGSDDVVLELKVRLLEFVRDDGALLVWFTADRRQTSREYPIWTLWPHDPRAYTRLLTGLKGAPDCCCVAVDSCSVRSASRCRRMAARAYGCVY